MLAKHKSILFFGSAFLAFVLCIYITHNNITKTKPEKACVYLQKKFLQKENLLQNYVDSINKQGIDNISDLLLFCQKHKIHENEFIFYIYQDSVLKAWSSNQINLPNILTQKPISQNTFSLERDYVYHIKAEDDSLCIMGFYMIKKWKNDDRSFLSLHNFTPNSSSQQIDVSVDEGKYNIFNNKGSIAFSIIFPDDIVVPDNIAFIELIAWIFAFSLFVLGIFWLMMSIPLFVENKNLIWIVLCFIIAIITNFLNIPASLYHSNLFSSLYYASFYSSLGILFIQSYAILIIALLLNQCFTLQLKNIKNSRFNYFLACLLIIIAFIFYILVFIIQHSIANDSTITITPILLYNYNGLSIIIIASICSLYCALLFVFRKLLEESYKLLGSLRSFIFILSIIVLFFIIITTLFYFYNYAVRPNYYIYLIIFLLFVIFIALHIIYPKHFSSVLTHTLAFALFSFTVFFITENANNKKVERHKDDFAQNLLLTEDPLMLFDLCEMEDNIRKDNKVYYYLRNDSISKDSIINYIHNQYLIKYIDSYRKNISLSILSTPNDRIIYETKKKLFNQADKFSNDKNIAFFQAGMGKSNYMIHIPIPYYKQQTIDTAILFIEMESLSDYTRPHINKTTHRIESEIAQLSYAEYINDTLKSYKESTAPYKLFLSEYNLDTLFNGLVFFADGYNHTMYLDSPDKVLLMSTYKDSLFKQLSSVSFILLIFLFYSIFPNMMLFFFGKKRVYISFKGQIQRMTVYLLLGSSIVGGILFARYTIATNKTQLTNQSINRINTVDQVILSALEDTSICIENLNIANIAHLQYDYINDINIFNLKGERINIHKNKATYLQSRFMRIEPQALQAIGEEKNSLFMHEAIIGNNKYVILYKPMRDQVGEIIAYLSYSTVTRQNRMDYQLTSFFSTFLSLYGLFILIALGIGSLVTQYISASLTEISKRLAKIKLKSINEKIEWKRNDEIGALIEEYNRLIDELELSAELLAHSERESTWKNMAKQVAHEIKNPLTPMKISTQQLQKEIMDGKINIDKLKAYTGMLLEQIDILNDISSSFSSYAKMHHGEGTQENLTQIIENLLTLHVNQNNYEISFVNKVTSKHAFVFINKTQLIRALNNLIRNAIQASKPNEKQKIIIELTDYGQQMWQILVQDFGIGMDASTKNLAFTAHFSTKTSGMGLGLVMVKNIITDWNGSISLESAPNIGSTFSILLPKANQQNISV